MAKAAEATVAKAHAKTKASFHTHAQRQTHTHTPANDDEEAEEEDYKTILSSLHAPLGNHPLTKQRALLDVQKREISLGNMLAPYLHTALDLVGLGDKIASAVCTGRVQGLLSTFDMLRPLPVWLSSRHYKCLSVLFVEVVFSLLVTDGDEGEEGHDEERQKKIEDYLSKVGAGKGLSLAEYRSLKGDFVERVPE